MVRAIRYTPIDYSNFYSLDTVTNFSKPNQYVYVAQIDILIDYGVPCYPVAGVFTKRFKENDSRGIGTKD